MSDKVPQKIPKEEISVLKDAILETNPNLFDGIAPRKRNAILKAVTSVTLVQQKMHSGPIPDAESLAQYNEIIPDGANRIMSMAENQQAHRIELENKVTTEQLNQSGKGQWFGFTLGIAGLAGGVYLGVNGFEIVGSIIGGGTVVSLVSVFVAGKAFK
ncbi:MAG: hypothetical protein COB12_00650 [Flavobacterium sp.]|nr:MAG: hypothetical protein COB12_00650 [Flavobacterium sp.]